MVVRVVITKYAHVLMMETIKFVQNISSNYFGHVRKLVIMMNSASPSVIENTVKI